MHEYKRLTHPLLEYYFPNNYIYHNNNEIQILGVNIIINQSDISHIYEIAEIVIKSHLAYYEDMCNKNEDPENHLSTKIYNLEMLKQSLSEKTIKRSEVKRMHNARNDFCSNNNRTTNSKMNGLKNKNVQRGASAGNLQYNRKGIENDNYKMKSTNLNKMAVNHQYNDKNTGINININKKLKRESDNTNNKDLMKTKNGDTISCIKISKNANDVTNYEKIMQICKLNEIEFPEFMIEKQNNVYFCKANFFENNFTSKYHYEKNMAREESCRMMLNFIENDEEEKSINLKNRGMLHIK